MKTNLQCSGRFRDLSALSQTPPPWTHVASLGEFPGEVTIPAGYDVPGYGIIREEMSVDGLTVFNRAVLDRLMTSFKPDVLIDADHLSHDTTQATEALGWGTELRFAGDGNELEMKTPWTPPGSEKISTQVYRYISPEFTGAVRFENDVFKFYPSALVGAGLTNRPKLTVLRPVSANRNKTGETRSKLALLLCRILEAPESTPDEELETKATAFLADGATSKNRADRVTELEKEIESLRCEAIERDLETYKDVIGDRESARELLQLNRDLAVKSLAAQLARRSVNPHQPLYQKNRATAPDGRKFTEPEDRNNEAQRSLVATIQNRDKCSFSTAWAAAKAEKPELF